MKSKYILNAVLWIISAITVGLVPVSAAPTIEIVTDGNFDNFAVGSGGPLGLGDWMVTRNPTDQPFGISLFDIDGVGILGDSKAFAAHVGGTSGGTLTLMQTVNLLEGIEYSFSADIASGTPASNIDGGQVTASIASINLLDQHDFGMILRDQPEFAVLQGTFIPAISGDYMLSILFGRDYQQNLNTPTIYLDNVSLTGTAQVVPAPGALLLSSIGLFSVRWLHSRRNVL